MNTATASAPEKKQRLLLELDSVSFNYPDGSVGLNACSLAIRRGTRNVLIGANGSGKTTLFQHANERFGQALDVLLAAVRTRKRPFYLSVHFAHVAEILVDRTEECLVDVVPFLHECFFLSGFGCLV